MDHILPFLPSPSRSSSPPDSLNFSFQNKKIPNITTIPPKPRKQNNPPSQKKPTNCNQIKAHQINCGIHCMLINYSWIWRLPGVADIIPVSLCWDKLIFPLPVDIRNRTNDFQWWLLGRIDALRSMVVNEKLVTISCSHCKPSEHYYFKESL